MATNEFWVDADQKKHEHTEWHHVVAWNQVADFVTQYCEKGYLVYVEGSVRTRTWVGSNKEKKKITEIVATHVMSLEKR